MAMTLIKLLLHPNLTPTISTQSTGERRFKTLEVKVDLTAISTPRPL